jgi:hypothetical protein
VSTFGVHYSWLCRLLLEGWELRCGISFLKSLDLFLFLMVPICRSSRFVDVSTSSIYTLLSTTRRYSQSLRLSRDYRVLFMQACLAYFISLSECFLFLFYVLIFFNQLLGTLLNKANQIIAMNAKSQRDY